MMKGLANVAVTVFLALLAAPALAGPPYISDDPEPTLSSYPDLSP